VKFIYEFLLKTGLREGELAMLRLRDCPDYLGGDVIEVYRGKGNKDRTLPISKRMRDEINSYVREVRPKTKPRWVGSDVNGKVLYNFTKKSFVQISSSKDEKGEPKQQIRASSTLYRLIKNIGAKAGITKRVYPHMLRHTFAVNTLRKGVNIYVLMHLLGHSDIRMTQRYLHLAEMMNAGLAEVLDND
jgi:integrase/recombinase XerD